MNYKIPAFVKQVVSEIIFTHREGSADFSAQPCRSWLLKKEKLH